MTLLRRLISAGGSAEARVFQFIAAFGLIVAAIYWFVSYEPAGSILLAVFGLATGVLAFLLTSRGTPGVDRPFGDETGEVAADTLAPFAVGLGIAMAATGLVFGLAPIVVGLLPLGWGSWKWLTAAGDELVGIRSRD